GEKFLFLSADGDFEKEFLDAHNTYRQKHGAPPLTMSRELSRSAQKWAEKLLAAKILKHSDTDDGENLFYASIMDWIIPSSDITFCFSGNEAVDKWYNEIEKYKFSRPGFQSSTGHFTQVVWKSSKELGLGVATDGRTIIVVGQYHPAGNVTNPGYFQENVLPEGTPADPVNKGGISDSVTQRLFFGSPADGDFEKEFLDAHNTYRQKHGAPPLTMSRELSRAAQKWAEKLLAANILKHSDTDDGENLFYASSNEAVDKWYNEIEKYKFSRPGFQSGTGHFTQVVWKSSKELGLGVATDGRTIIVVGQYHPAGNVTNPGYFQENVLPEGTPADPVNKGVEKVTSANQLCFGSPADGDFEKEFLDAHNTYRQKHGAPPLTMSRELSISAQKWAEKLLAANILKHSDTDDGENLFYASSSSPKKYSAVDKWYNEIEKYKFSRPGFQSGTGHFTQVVWKSSKELGLGVATDGRTIIVVGQYHPAGNFTNPGYFQENVLPEGPTTPAELVQRFKGLRA
uniref:SCP domain-containing protein n=1 Tax=Denticeps clupeoides TaxID=299321 RepID=A0AAY4EIA1_9TELE